MLFGNYFDVKEDIKVDNRILKAGTKVFCSGISEKSFDLKDLDGEIFSNIPFANADKLVKDYKY